MKRFLRFAARTGGFGLRAFGATGRATIALIGICGVVAALANYAVTQGSGTNFGSIVVGSVHYAQQLVCDYITPSQCAHVGTTGSLQIDEPSVSQFHTDLNQLHTDNNSLLAAIGNPPTLGSASGGLLVKTLAALSTTPVAIKASTGQTYKIQCYNPDASNSAAIELFNSASVTLGTTAVFDFVEIGPGQNAGSVVSLVGVQYSTAITAAAVKTIGGSTAPTTALDCTVYYN